MKSYYAFALLVVVAGVAVAAAQQQETDALIALDKQWGEGGMKDDRAKLGTILADDVMVVQANGTVGKAETIAENEPDPDPNARYQAGDYQVMFLGPETAIMSHSAAEHHSLHVWAKRGGIWQVVATASVPHEESSQ